MSSELELDQWEIGAVPTLFRLMATLQSARAAASMGPIPMGWATDQIHAALRDGEEWSGDHPCPRVHGEAEVRRMLRTYRIVASLFALETQGASGPNTSVIDREVGDLIGTIASLFAAESGSQAR